MTPRSIRRAAERKAKRAALKSQKAALSAISLDPHETFEETDTLDTYNDTAISESQLTANRANAQLSTGPRSPEGKAKASLNAVKSGLTGRTVLLVGDDAADYDRHLRGFAQEYAPVGQRESDLVQSIADTWWRLQRIPCLENALFAQGYVEFADAFDDRDPSLRLGLIQAQAFLKYEKQIRNLHLQESRLFRRYEKDRAELRELQQQRSENEIQAREAAATAIRPARTNPPTIPNGFEFSNSEMQHSAPADSNPNSPGISHGSAQIPLNIQAQAA